MHDAPLVADQAADGPRSRHPQLVHGLMADGAVRKISNNVNALVYLHLGSRAGGEPPGDF